MDGIQVLFTDVVSFQKDLSFARSVSEVDKTNGSFAAIGFHESDDGDIFADKVCSFLLQFAEGVCAESGWNPSGHERGVEAQNMNHSLEEFG